MFIENLYMFVWILLLKGLPLKEGSDSYKNWVSPPAPIFFQIWVQHVTNSYEVVQFGAKPVLVEKGPYTYRYTCMLLHMICHFLCTT